MATIADGKGVLCLAAFDTSAELKKHEFGRPEVGPNDVSVSVKYCGMCHSDCHACNGDWGLSMFPMTPGHEIAGVVDTVGGDVTEFKVGDKVGVGCMVYCCGTCDLCQQGLEQHCPKMCQTYSNIFPEGQGENYAKAAGYHTNGGYSSAITVNKKFVFHIPESMAMEYAGVLLCAGITTFSPLNRHILQKGGGEGKSVGIVGFGGLGQMAVKIAKAMGAEVTVFSRSESKKKEAEKLGANLLVHADEEAVKAAYRTFDVVLDTVAAPHPVAPLVNTLKVGGTYCVIGGVAEPFEIGATQMLMNRQAIEGSLIGGLPETQEMLDFCAKHNIIPEYEVISAAEANDHFKALMGGTADAKRGVLDMSTLEKL